MTTKKKIDYEKIFDIMMIIISIIVMGVALFLGTEHTLVIGKPIVQLELCNQCLEQLAHYKCQEMSYETTEVLSCRDCNPCEACYKHCDYVTKNFTTGRYIPEEDMVECYDSNDIDKIKDKTTEWKNNVKKNLISIMKDCYEYRKVGVHKIPLICIFDDIVHSQKFTLEEILKKPKESE